MTDTKVPVYENFSVGKEEAMPVRLAAGKYERGEVLGRVGNIYGKLDVENAVPAAIMPFEMECDREVEKAVYVTGNFNQDKLIFGSKDIETVKTALRDVGIFVRKWNEE